MCLGVVQLPCFAEYKTLAVVVSLFLQSLPCLKLAVSISTTLYRIRPFCVSDPWLAYVSVLPLYMREYWNEEPRHMH